MMDAQLAPATVSRNGRVMYGTDDDLAVTFYMRAVKDERESARQGRPIFKDVPYVKIQMPGDKLSAHETKVTEEHKLRWPRHWDLFQAGHTTEQTIGTPLKEWPPLSASQIAQMNALGITTVEQLAGLTDTGLERLGMHARTLQQRARAFLEAAHSTAPIETLAAENEQLKERLAALETANRQTAEALERANQLMSKMVAQQTSVADAGGHGGAQTAVVTPSAEGPGHGGGGGNSQPAKRGPGRPRKDAGK